MPETEIKSLPLGGAVTRGSGDRSDKPPCTRSDKPGTGGTLERVRARNAVGTGKRTERMSRNPWRGGTRDEDFKGSPVGGRKHLDTCNLKRRKVWITKY